MDIEFSSIIGDSGGIYKLPLAHDFQNSLVRTKFSALKNDIKKETGVNATLPNYRNNKTKLSFNLKQKIKNYLAWKDLYEKSAGKVSHRYYQSTSINTVGDFATKYHKELKRNKRTGKLVRSGRTLAKMMNEKSEFYIKPGIYIVLGCRNIGFANQPLVNQMSHKRSRPTNSNNKYNTHIENVRKYNQNMPKKIKL
jgi:hypothetical protein